MTKFTYVSLFSGIGGFEQALNQLGGTCVLASEIDKFANQVYKALYGHETAGDITKIDAEDVPDHDLLVGGFPCQAFSVAGKRGGFEDARGTLFFEIARIASEKKPKAMVLENVKGLVGHLSNADFEGALKHQIEKGEIFWQRNENSLMIKSDIAKKNAENYLLEMLENESDLQKDKSFTSSKSMSDIPTEKAESYLAYGLIKRLQSLKTQISQTTKKLKGCQGEQIQLLGCKGDDLVLSLEKLCLTEKSKVKDIPICDETESMLSEAELLWRNISAENFQPTRSSITSTEINPTIELKTCIFAMAEVSIITSIIKHLNLSESLLRKVSWASIKGKEYTFLIPTLDVIVTTLNDIGYTLDFDVLNSKYFGVPQNRERIFIIAVRDDLIEASPWDIPKQRKDVVAKGKRRIGALAGVKTFNFDWPAQEAVTTRMRDILESEVDEKYYLSEEKTAALVSQLNEGAGLGKDGALGTVVDGGNVSPCIDASYAKGIGPSDVAKNRNRRPHVLEIEPQMLGHIDLKGHDAIKRVYSAEGVSPTLTTMGGEHREPKIAEEVRPVLTPNRIEKRQNGRRFKGNDEEAFTLTAQDKHGVAIGKQPSYRIRKLTPLECWRLQGFSDEAHTAVKAAGISDSQRYKQAGNAVTVNVISAIGKRLIMLFTPPHCPVDTNAT